MSNASNNFRLDYVEFPATNLALTKRFYGEVFGWRFTDYGPDYTSFEDGRLTGGFHTERPVVGGGVLPIIYATDLDSTESKVKAAGGEITLHHEFPGGRRFHFIDPNGNEVAVWSDR